MFREEATSALAGFMWVLHPGRIGIWRCWFLWRKVTRRTKEKPSEQGENQQQTQPTYDNWLELNPGHIGRRRALSALRHPYSPICNKHICTYTRLFVFLASRQKANEPGKFCLEVLSIGVPDELRMYAWLRNKGLF